MVEYRELVRVFWGPVAEATVLRSALAARGIESFIQYENIKVMDPFATGANALDVELVVPEEQVEAAAEAVAEMRRIGAGSVGPREAAAEEGALRLRWILIGLLLFLPGAAIFLLELLAVL